MAKTSALQQTLRIVKQDALQIGIGKRIVAIRKSKGITQEKLADAAAMTRNSLSDAELGKSDIRISTVRRIATALKCTLAELMPDYPADA